MAPGKICEVCGHPVKSTPGKVTKRYHDACKRWRNYLDASVRAAREMNPRPTPRQAIYIRQEATRAANQMAALAQPRDSRGRFRAATLEELGLAEHYGLLSSPPTPRS
jgi:hypothetical protein